MRSPQLHSALASYVQEAGERLQVDVAAGAEIPFEVETRSGRGGPSLYCYRPLTADYIAQRQPEIEALSSHGEAAARLALYEGLDRYLAASGIEAGPRATKGARARMALRALLADVFAEQSTFEVRAERLQSAITRLEQAAGADGAAVTLVATLHGLTIASEQIQLTSGLTIAHPEAVEGLPEGVRPATLGQEAPTSHLVAVLSLRDEHPARALAEGRAVLRDLLRALRLFGDGRLTLGALAYSRTAGGAWTPLALGTGGRPRGILLVTAEQEDELRAFCNLVSRRAPADNEIAWALRRFELGCERESPYEALSDDLLALRVLLEPEGSASGMLPGRLAALCATPPRRRELTERTIAALALERAVIDGSASEDAGGFALVSELGDHLRALLRDVICGHLDVDLRRIADEILLEPEHDQQSAAAAAGPLAPEHAQDGAPVAGAGPVSVEQMLGYMGEAQEVLDLSV
ncbi:MAG TPA: hypothetical protein VKG82_01470 [Solirubrobacteraceae bacterium]|nr:hypothetical protein [Solirubrobacteraceae bacterium]